MKTKNMEVEEKTLPAVDNPDENNSKKGKILTLLFPAESQPVEGKESKKDKNKPPTKVVIRRLPPKLTKEGFLEEFSPLPAHDYFHFVRGDLNLGPHAFSRAYINFVNQEDIFLFKEKFDDYDLQDEKGKAYHAVVEFAPFQKIPRRNVMKKKLSKAGTLESDPKYIEFLQKLEEAKNFINNPSEYFHETESSALKTKVITTPLLEYLKRKKQKKIDLKNEIRQRKREAEREKRRKEDEKRKAERERRKEEKKNLEKNKMGEDKGKKIEERMKDKKVEDKVRVKEEKKDSKNRKNLENDSIAEEHLDSIIPNDPAILEVVVRHSTSEKDSKSGLKTTSGSNDETKSLKSNESETSLGRSEKKYSEFRTRLAEEKQRKTFYKRDADESKTLKTSQGIRKGVPDEKGDNCNIGNCSEIKDCGKKLDSNPDSKRYECRTEVKETKSKFRYSEQRNRDREYRQKTSDFKISKDNKESNVECKSKVDSEKGKKGHDEDVKKASSEPKTVEGKKNTSTDSSLPSRRKSLEMEREMMDTERKRSKSFHDVSSKEFCEFDGVKKSEGDRGRDVNTPENELFQTDDNSKGSTESDKMDDDMKKERRVERRIRNKRMHPCDCHPSCTYTKDRPSIEIYRPGMGKFSKQRLEQKKDDSNSTSPPSTPYSSKPSSLGNKPNSKKNLPDKNDNSHKNNGSNGKMQSEVRTMTFTRSSSKEN